MTLLSPYEMLINNNKPNSIKSLFIVSLYKYTEVVNIP